MDKSGAPGILIRPKQILLIGPTTTQTLRIRTHSTR